ncbi:40S ribosomal protein S29, partial [Striga hermonthica]
AEKIAMLVKALNITVESYRPRLFAKLSEMNIKDLVSCGASRLLLLSIVLLPLLFILKRRRRMRVMITWASAFSIKSQVFGNPHAIIRKYGLMCCRECFCTNAKDIGFVK